MLPVHHGKVGSRRRRSLQHALRRVSAPVCSVLLLLSLLSASLLLRRGVASLASRAAARHGGLSVPSVEVVTAEPDAAPPSPAQEAACGPLVSAWLSRAAALSAARAGAPALNLTYFLHVPRTAGRTTFWCALKPAFAPSERCTRAYDHVRTDLAQPACSLLSSHDDWSLVDGFPGKVTLATQLRAPLDRVLSAYEFSVEVAARYASANRPPARNAAGKPLDTRTVWPWSVLVPLMVDDMRARAAQRGDVAPVRSAGGGGGYAESEAYLPLREFVAHPSVAEVLHNGAAFQLLGLTNNSAGGETARQEAQSLRACARAPGQPAAELGAYARHRLQTEVSVVTLTERLRESAAMLAAALGRPLSGPSYKTAADWAKGEAPRGTTPQQFDAAARQPDRPLGAVFSACADKQHGVFRGRKTADHGRVRFSDGQGISFRRDSLPPEVLEDILRANALDVALYELGVREFDDRKRRFQHQGLWESVDEVVVQAGSRDTA